MTISIAVLATVVAVASAVRSTWSPCGLSMLSTITPLSERARGHSYRATAGWFVLGATAGGATLGMAIALLAIGARSLHLSPDTLGRGALAAALIAVVSDSGVAGVRLPIHRRQVNERWLDQYRSWVYGSGFGWQIGTGLATYVTSAGVYLMIVLGALTADPMPALALGTTFGLLRGLAVLLTRHLTSPTRLRSFHRRFAVAGPWAGKAVVGAEVGVVAVLVATIRSPDALAMVTAAVGVAMVSLVVVRGRGSDRASAVSWPGIARATPPGPARTERGPEEAVPAKPPGLAAIGPEVAPG